MKRNDERFWNDLVSLLESAVEDILSEDGPLEEANEEEIIEESSGDYELEASETLESSGGDETLLEGSGQEGSGVIWPQVKMVPVGHTKLTEARRAKLSL